MIEVVFVFGLVNIVFEFVLLSMLSPRTRLRVLGSPSRGLIHVALLLANLMIHWGTVTGSMASILAFCASIVTVEASRRLFGYIEDSRYYHTGLIRYSASEIK